MQILNADAKPHGSALTIGEHSDMMLGVLEAAQGKNREAILFETCRFFRALVNDCRLVTRDAAHDRIMEAARVCELHIDEGEEAVSKSVAAWLR